MKAAFLMMCILCAFLLSTLIFSVKTGRIPFRQQPPQDLSKTEHNVQPVGIGSMPFASEDEKKTVDELIKSLTAEKEAVAAMRTELTGKEDSIKVKEAALAGIKAEVQELQNQLNDRLLEVRTAEQANLQRLASVYAKMDPSSAAKLLKEMDSTNAATVLSLITERSAAGIMDAMIQENKDGSVKAAEWSDIIRRLKAEKAKEAQPGE